MKTGKRNIHADWLNLIEVSGPFLTPATLGEALPAGLDQIGTDKMAALRAAFAQSRPQGHLAEPEAFCLHVLTEQLGYDSSVLVSAASLAPDNVPELCLPELGTTIRPDYVLLPPPDISLGSLLGRAEADRPKPAKAQPALLISICPGQQPGQPVRDGACSWSPQQRMAELCRAADIPTGLVCTGEHFTLVHAPRQKTATYVTWLASLWLEERIALEAFVTLLHKRRFFAVRADLTLGALLAKSAEKQQTVTEKLGLQARGAITEFIRAIDRIAGSPAQASATWRQLLASLPAPLIYEAALTVMMRLVFLLTAEERGLLRLGNAFWDESYAVSTIWQSLRAAADRHGEKQLEYRGDAWPRLLALFRAVYGGVSHEALNLPAYGGSLFDPDKYPFLEGRAAGTSWRHDPAAPLPISNRVILRMLEALQFLRDPRLTGSSEAVRLSFRGLDVEQIGHVYEGLLDRTAARASEVLLGLDGKKEEFIALAEAEALLAQDRDRLLARLRELTGRTEASLRGLLDGKKTQQGSPGQAASLARLELACDGDSDLARRIQPFLGLLRLDHEGLPVLALPGQLHVTLGSQRRDSGTHYTPRRLTEVLVAATLEPHVYHGPAEGLPREQWQPCSAAELLGLKICDMAMGSGAFLVQACRYLSEKLLEAWEREQTANLPVIAEEREALARRQITDNCLYGVDNNPLAVEMARLSLWLVTMRKDRPFTFLDHVLRCGDALLGLTSLEQFERFTLFPSATTELVFGSEDMRATAQAALQKRAAIPAIASDSIIGVERKAALLAAAEADIRKLRLRADALIMATVRGKGKLSHKERFILHDKLLSHLLTDDELAEWLAEQRQTLIAGTGTAKSEKDADDNPGFTQPLHWALEFPEVFNRVNPGFDAIIGNPPFLGSQRMREALGNFYREYLVNVIGQTQRGIIDQAAYFFLRASQLTRKDGDFGLIATNTIAQGDTREGGLLLLEQAGCKIRAAWPDVPWEGNAAVTTSQIVIRNSPDWQGVIRLSDEKVDAISSFLKAGAEQWVPTILRSCIHSRFMSVWM